MKTLMEIHSKQAQILSDQWYKDHRKRERQSGCLGCIGCLFYIVLFIVLSGLALWGIAALQQEGRDFIKQHQQNHGTGVR